jgi:hypothetical protein
MKVITRKRKSGHDPKQLLESITTETDLVRLEASDYDDELSTDLDFEDRIICGRETIMADTKKVLGIIDMELFMKYHMDDHFFEDGDLVKYEDKLYIKTPVGFVQAEIK